MSTDMHPDPFTNQMPDTAGEAARHAAMTVRETTKRGVTNARGATEAVKQGAKRATDTAKDVYLSAAQKAGDTLETSKEVVRQNPMRVVLGAVTLGAVFGFLLTRSKRKRSFSERYADEPLDAVREAILAALAPVAHRVHEGHDSARIGARKVKDQVHSFCSGRTRNSVSDRIGRFGNKLKFW